LIRGIGITVRLVRCWIGRKFPVRLAVTKLSYYSRMKTALLFTMLFLISMTHAQTPTAKQHLLIGTYSIEGKPNGIHVYTFDANTGDFSIEQPVTGLENASYIAISNDEKNVYAVSEQNGGGTVNAYAFDASNGALKLLNSVPAYGPCYVSVDDNKKVVFVGNYGGGSLQAIHLNADGSFVQNTVQTIKHEGKSVVADRQEKSHVHAVVLSPDNQYLLVPDLGTDKVFQYKINPASEKIVTPATTPFFDVKAGGGPRHLTFHPNGKYAYLVLELEAGVMALDYSNGKLSEKQTISMLTPDFKGRRSGADIHISPDGKFLYATNRGEANEIIIYSIDSQGKLSLIKQESVQGKIPRNFAIDPSGNFVLVANQESNDVIIFKRDAKTGTLTTTGKKIEIGKPVCLKFAAIKK